jgi:hypothetical protein
MFQAQDPKLEMAPKARWSNLVVQKIKDETLVYNLESNRAFCLNQTASLVWNECNGLNTIEDINQNLIVKYQQKFSVDLVVLTIHELKKQGLIENDSIKTMDFTSRREIVKKVGLATTMALPVISSVIAPGAIMAQSGLPFGASCSSDPQCASGNCSNFSPSTCCAGSGEGQTGTPFACLSNNLCFLTGLNDCCSGLGSSSGFGSCTTPLGFPGFQCVCT